MRVVGIDPGVKGAVAVVDGGVLVHLADASSASLDAPGELLALMRGAELVVVERPVAYPGFPACAQMVLAAGYGQAVALARLAGADLVVPTARQWKAAVGVTSDKRTAQARAAALYGVPDTTRDDLCEAALLAHYGAHYGGSAPRDASLAKKTAAKRKAKAKAKAKAAQEASDGS